ncbi:UNVERIFIED_CONTAM: hypothetical protein FKN15_036789 [Acipenser sinensis]
MAYVKSGWLLRQSTILRRWKKNWFDLWSDGRLVFYDDQHRRDMEDKIHMKVDCINIRSGDMCRDFQPPEGKGRDCLLQVVCRDGRTINLCAESADDALDPEMDLEELIEMINRNTAAQKEQTKKWRQELGLPDPEPTELELLLQKWEQAEEARLSAAPAREVLELPAPEELLQGEQEEETVPEPEEVSTTPPPQLQPTTPEEDPALVNGLAVLRVSQGFTCITSNGSPLGFTESTFASAPPPYTEYAAPVQQVYNYDPHGAYGPMPPPGSQVVYASNGQPYAVAYQYSYQGHYPPPGVNQVIVREQYRDDTGDIAMGMLAGAATGMALGSLFWVF